MHLNSFTITDESRSEPVRDCHGLRSREAPRFRARIELSDLSTEEARKLEAMLYRMAGLGPDGEAPDGSAIPLLRGER